MARRLFFVLVIGVLIGTVFGGPPVAIGEIRQSKLVAVKEAAGPFDLDGTYRFRLLYLEDFEDIDRGALILVGSIEFNGAAGTWTSTGNKILSDGSSEPDAGTGTYTVNLDGSVEFINPTDGQTWHGDLSSDSKILIMTLGDTAPGGEICLSILVAIKDEGKLFTKADLDGTYRFRTLEVHRFEYADTDAVVCIATIECDGQGNSTATYTCFLSDYTSESGTADETYSVNAENSFEFAETGVPGMNFSADSSSDGNILILTKGKVNQLGGIAQWIGTAIKEDPAKTFTNADLNGKYRGQWLTFLDYESNDKEAEAGYGTFTFDGTGSWTATANTFDSDGEIDPVTPSGTYRVNPDGSFEVTVTSGSTNETWTGDISSDGELYVMTCAQQVATGGGDDGGWCFVATVAFGSPIEPYVMVLREFRDRFLLTNALGKTFVDLYYTYSPPMADYIANHDILRAMVRVSLLPLVGVSYSMLQFGPVVTLSMFVGLVVLPIFLVTFYRRKARSHRTNN